MLGRRSALLGLLGMPGMGGPLMAMRPTSTQIANVLTAGLPGGPQVLVGLSVNYAVTTSILESGLPAADVTSISNLQNVIEMPTGLAAEKAPAIIGPVQVTYTDGSAADGLLILDGLTGSAPPNNSASFTLYLSANPSGSKHAVQIQGFYTLAGATITLNPLTALDPSTNTLQFYTSGGASAGVFITDPAGTNLVPAIEPFHSLGSTGLAGDAGTASYKFSAENEVILSIHKSFNALGAITTANFASALPPLYIPPASRLTGGAPISLNNAAPGSGTRLTITGGTGVVNLVNLPAGTTAVGCDVRIPLV